MNELEFRQWLSNNDVPKKVQSDFVSRLKRFERINGYIDLEEEYEKDNCSFLFSLFKNKGINDDMKKLGANELPIGKYQLSTYKYALSQYVKYLKDKNDRAGKKPALNKQKEQ